MKIADGLVLALKVTLRPDMHAFVFALRVRLKARHHRANFVDPPHRFVTEDTTVGDGRSVAFQNVRIGTADCRSGDLHHCIGRFHDGGFGFLFPGSFPG